MSADRAAQELACGRTVVLVDALAEAPCVLAVAGECVEPQDVNFMLEHGRGGLTLAMPEARWSRLGLAGVAGDGHATFRAAGDRTSISARQRARAVRVAVDPRSGPGDLLTGGPVGIAAVGTNGAGERSTLADAAMALARLANCAPAVLMSAILDAEGEPVRPAAVRRFCRAHGLAPVRVEDIQASGVERVVSTAMPTRSGPFTAVGYRSYGDSSEHVALVRGAVRRARDVPVALHTRCIYGDVFRSTACDCSRRVQEALTSLSQASCGALLYLDCRGDPAAAEPCRRRSVLAPGEPAPAGDRAFSADRTALAATSILRDLGVRSIRLIASGEHWRHALVLSGVPVAEATSDGRPADSHGTSASAA